MGLKYHGIKQFYLMGDEHASKREVEIGVPRDIEDLQHGIATEYTIVKPEGTVATPPSYTKSLLTVTCK